MFDFTICLPTESAGEPLEMSFQGARRAFGRGWLERSGIGRVIESHAGDLSILAYGRVRLDGRALDERDGSVKLAGAWRRNGPDMVRRLDGEFLLAIADRVTGAWVAAVDRFSSFRLYYGSIVKGAAFGTAPIAVAGALGKAPEVNAQAVLAYAYFHVVPAPLSICSGVRRLDHGELLLGDGAGELGVRRYWQPHFEETRPFEFSGERDRFMSALRTGISECVEGQCADEVGCFLSGGTDSSTIAGLVTEHFGSGARTFSIGFGVSGYDESHYSRIAVKHFGTRHTECYLQPVDVERALPILASDYEQPFGNSSAVPTFFCARLGLDAGVRRMLGGDGGDELYGGNERYAKQWIFSVWNDVPAPIRVGLVEPILFGPLAGIDIAALRKARSYIDQTRVPLPERLQGKYNLLERFGRGTVFTAAFLERAEPFEPAELAREVWARTDAASEINKLLAYDFKFTLADSDLPKVTRMCEAAGVEVSYPMLTKAVVDHSLQLAPGQKLHRTKLRYFFKNALRGFLPDAILRKEKHGFGLPFGAWALTQPGLMALADDALAGLAKRGFIRPAFVGDLRQALASGHADYYGTMVWILAVLELWLREHLPDARCA